jgi:ribose-phosphate pyrophosphokinase
MTLELDKNHPILYATDGFVGSIDDATYPDGMPIVVDPSIPQRILLRPTTVTDLMTALWWVDSLRFRGVQSPIELVLPNMPGARQDRLNPSGDRLFTAKSIANEINARNFSKVTVVDPHSDVTPALLRRAQVVTAADVLQHALRMHAKAPNWDVVISPDAGAEKRASQVAKMLGVPLVHAWKTRDIVTGSIAGFGCEPFPFTPTGVGLVVDDLCDGGGTFLGLVEKLPRTMVYDLYTTHGLYTHGTQTLRQRFRRLISTDSTLLCRNNCGADRLPVCGTLLMKGTL